MRPLLLLLLPLLLLPACGNDKGSAADSQPSGSRTVERAVADVEAAREDAARPPPARVAQPER